MNTGSAAGLPSASAHCCHLPMRSGRGRALAGPRGHGSASARPGPSQPSRMGSDPRPASGARRQPPQEPTLAGAAAGRSGPLCAHPGIPGPHAALAGLCTAPTYGRGKHAPRCPGATSPVTLTVQQAAATPPPRAAAPTGPGAPAGTTAASRISSHCGLVPAQGLGHGGRARHAPPPWAALARLLPPGQALYILPASAASWGWAAERFVAGPEALWVHP